MNTMKISELKKEDLAIKSVEFSNGVEAILEDVAFSINDLDAMLRDERMSEKEKAMIKDWMERLQTLSDEVYHWNSLYD